MENDAIDRAALDRYANVRRVDRAKRVVELVDGVNMMKNKARIPPCDVLLTPHDGVPGHVDADVPPLLVQIVDELKGSPANAAAHVEDGHVGQKADILLVVLNLLLTDRLKRVRSRASKRYEVARNLEALEHSEPIDRGDADRTSWRDRHAHIAPRNWQRCGGCLRHNLELVSLFKRKRLKLLWRDQPVPFPSLNVDV